MKHLEQLLSNVPIRKTYKLYITGHSLGGALATLFGFYASCCGGGSSGDASSSVSSLPITIVSVASPRVGNIAFARAFVELESLGRLRHLRIANHKDPVTLNPTVSAKRALALSAKMFSPLGYLAPMVTGNGEGGEEEVYYHTGMKMKLQKDICPLSEKQYDIQQHVIKIPALEGLVIKIRSYLKDRSPSYVRNAINRVESSGAYTLLTSKYTAWLVLGSVVIFWQYRKQMYERTSEEMANVAALTLKQDALRQTIQETLTTVANSPETLASLSILFQQLISESRTEAQLIYLIVRALNSEGVREAAIKLLDASFKNDGLQLAAGELLKVATNATFLDEQVQRNAGVGIHRAMKNAVVPQFWWMNKNNSSNNIPHNDTDTRTTDNGHAEPEGVRSNDDVDDLGVGQRLENNNKTQEEAMTKQND